jgi:hypothetical protein
MVLFGDEIRYIYWNEALFSSLSSYINSGLMNKFS